MVIEVSEKIPVYGWQLIYPDDSDLYGKLFNATRFAKDLDYRFYLKIDPFEFVCLANREGSIFIGLTWKIYNCPVPRFEAGGRLMSNSVGHAKVQDDIQKMNTIYSILMPEIEKEFPNAAGLKPVINLIDKDNLY